MEIEVEDLEVKSVKFVEFQVEGLKIAKPRAEKWHF